MTSQTSAQGITFPFALPDTPGHALRIADNLYWLRVPLPFPPSHVNAYILTDDDGLTVIDPGINDAATRALWEGVLTAQFAGRPLRRILITHHHVDHIGLAGWFALQGAELLMTRASYYLARALYAEYESEAAPVSIAYWKLCGLQGEALARRITAKPHNMRDHCAPLPPRYTRLIEGQRLRLGGRDWLVRFGEGHAPEHATLWHDEIIIAGDTMLPGISPNIGAWPAEPEADTVGGWLTSCARFLRHATPDHLVLPGHKLPYRGLPFRLTAMLQNHHSALDRLAASLTSPARVHECFTTMFSRQIGEGETGLALAETLAHLTYLERQGRIRRSLGADGAWLWQALPATPAAP